MVRANRGAYLADALTVIRGWIQAGCPKSGKRPVNGFGQWADWCREPIVWLGLPDPCATMFATMNEDPDREQLGRVIDAWNKTFAHQAVMVRELIRRAADVADLHDALSDVAGFKGEIDHKHLGKWLKSNAGKIVSGKRIVRDHTFKRNSAYWKLLTLSQQSATGNDYTDSSDSSAQAAA
jgi:putative DNA primase/helicase